MSIRIKGEGHQPLTKKLRRDWLAMFSQHPEAFPVALYRPKEKTAPSDEVDQDTFIDLDRDQSAFEYYPPEDILAIEVPTDDEGLSLTFTADGSIGSGETEIIALRLSAETVPQSSAIAFYEMVGEERVKRWWFIQRSVGVGGMHLPTVAIHYCVPYGDIEKD